MPQLIDESGGMYAMASAAGAAQGRARGTTMNGWDAATQAIQPLLANIAEEGRKRKNMKDTQALLDEVFASDPDHTLLDEPSKGLLAGMHLAGADAKTIAAMTQHLMDKKQAADLQRAVTPIKQQQADAGTMRATAAATNADSQAERRSAQTDQGSRRLDQQEGAQASRESFGVLRADQNQQRLDMQEQQGSRRLDIAQQNAETAANRPAPGSETEAQTTAKQLHLDHQEAVRHAADMKGWYFGLKREQANGVKVDQAQLAVAERAWRSARTEERETVNVLREGIGAAGASKRAPASSPRSGGDPIEATKQAFRAKHRREPDPANPDDVAEMRALHDGGGP